MAKLQQIRDARRVFLDANVLQAAARGQDDARHLLGRLRWLGKEFATSNHLRLEVLPTPIRNRYVAQVAFLEAYFRSSRTGGRNVSNKLVELAFAESCRTGAAPGDALHLAAAHLAGAEVLITGERDDRPMFRSRLVLVVSMNQALRAVR